MLAEEKHDRAMARLRASAFTAWQTVGELRAMSFSKYLGKLGIGYSSPRLTKEEKDAAIKRGLDVGRKITEAMDKNGFTKASV